MAGSSRSVLQISKPSISGSITSSTIRSGVCARAFFKRLRAVGGRADGVTGLLEVELDQFHRFRLVVHN